MFSDDLTAEEALERDVGQTQAAGDSVARSQTI